MTFIFAEGTLASTPSGAMTRLSDGFELRIDILEDWLVRVAVAPEDGFAVDRTWMIAPAGDVAWEGRDRLSTDGFAPAGKTRIRKGDLVERGGWRIAMQAAPFGLTFHRLVDKEWRPVLGDRPTGACQWFAHRGIFRHFQARSLKDRHYGLGDKTGPLDHTGRRLRCLQTDTLGYDAETTDPLYKHTPFLIADDDETGAVGVFYDTLSEIVFDLGAEHSNYHPHYRHVDVLEKGLVYYVIAGPRIRDIVPRLMQLTGKAAFPPRWSMGFAFTTMHHADALNAQAVMTEFAERCRQEHVPISAIHSGSGYTTKADGRRYVFTWNSSKFPDRDGFFERLGQLGFETAANVKPVLLTEHPEYERAAGEGWLVRSENGAPSVEMFWGGSGSSLDFTKPGMIEWWKEGISTQVLGAGFSAAWNDNNEAELWDETATVDGFGRPLQAIATRPLQALLMMRATYEATLARSPDTRPYTISRAGPVGIARYGETWSGDNRTSWHTLKWNLRQGLSMSMSGMPFIGHDIGGFDGPKAGPELLVRWVQMMALHPRAVMNSWKPQLDDPATVPWMHPEATDHVRAALELRYRFLPLLYHLAWKSHCEGAPLIAPTFYHFDDPECRDDADAFMLGPDVLVAPVVDEKACEVNVFLPSVEGVWQSFESGATFEGGRRVTVDAPIEHLPIFVRTGAILPLAHAWPSTAPHDFEAVELTLFAGDGRGHSQRLIFFDDGLGWGYRDNDASLVMADAKWNNSKVSLSVREQWSGRGRPRITLASRPSGGRRFDADIAF